MRLSILYAAPLISGQGIRTGKMIWWSGCGGGW